MLNWLLVRLTICKSFVEANRPTVYCILTSENICDNVCEKALEQAKQINWILKNKRLMRFCEFSTRYEKNLRVLLTGKFFQL